ncbi:MAG: DNA polymerase III subunit epsilon [Gammaproteobacteria bacterium]|nr:DNA polymerase III subunit epsilon [Gammaproteobacteria bacterium]
MRQIVLDTETTGLEVTHGHRIIEIGCVELVARRPTGRHFHRYLNPEREVDEGATAVHGLTLDKLRREPTFAVIAAEFLAFIEGAELIIHNAAFDVGFLNAEIARLPGEQATIESSRRVLDTLALARELHPGQRNNLDALCKRYGIDNSKRELHGALLDARILADVYLAMTGGQSALQWGETSHKTSRIGETSQRWVRREGATLKVIQANAVELAAHEAMLAKFAQNSSSEDRR